MAKEDIVPQWEYKNLEEFKKYQNNFFLFFVGDGEFARLAYRSRKVFLRFSEQYPDLERELTKSTIEAIRSRPERELPYAQLYQAYKIMSKLVQRDDDGEGRGPSIYHLTA